MPFFPSVCSNSSMSYTLTPGEVSGGYCILQYLGPDDWNIMPVNCSSLTCDTPRGIELDAMLADGSLSVGMCIVVACIPAITH